MNNLEEYLADTNPTNSTSCLALIGVWPQTNAVLIAWIGGVNASQVVEYRGNLADPSESWTAMFTNLPPTAVTNALLDAAWTTNRFYRIRAWR